MQRPDRGGSLDQDFGPLEVVVAQRLSVEIAQQQDPEVGSIVDDLCADACLLGGLGVVVFAIAVNAQHVGRGVDAAGDVHRVRSGDLDIAVGQAARQFLQLPRPPGEHGDLLEQFLETGVGGR